MGGRKKKKKKKDRRDYLGLEVDATLFLVDRAALALPQGRLAVDVVGRVYLSIKNRSATRTLFLRPYLAHFCPVFSPFFAGFSVLKPGFQKVAPKDRGAVP